MTDSTYTHISVLVDRSGSMVTTFERSPSNLCAPRSPW